MVLTIDKIAAELGTCGPAIRKHLKKGAAPGPDVDCGRFKYYSPERAEELKTYWRNRILNSPIVTKEEVRK